MLPDADLIAPPVSLPPLERLQAIMHRLRAPGGCPWDAEQTSESLIPNLIEESHEVIDTIRRGDDVHLQEELGDLLLQVVFHSELAQERGAFDLDAVATGISEKLVRRHPHVFGATAVGGSEGVLRQWEQIKREEKAGKAAAAGGGGNGGEDHGGALGDAGRGLPALLAAEKIQRKAAKVGFDWPDVAGVIAKVREELDEVEAELAAAEEAAAARREELGDLLFAVVNLVRHCGENPEECLSAANRKFRRRFRAMERSLEAAGMPVGVADPEAMEAAWAGVKEAE